MNFVKPKPAFLATVMLLVTFTKFGGSVHGVGAVVKPFDSDVKGRVPLIDRVFLPRQELLKSQDSVW